MPSSWEAAAADVEDKRGTELLRETWAQRWPDSTCPVAQTVGSTEGTRSHWPAGQRPKGVPCAWQDKAGRGEQEQTPSAGGLVGKGAPCGTRSLAKEAL